MSSESVKRHQMGTRITVTIPPDHCEQVCRMAKGGNENFAIIRSKVLI